MTSCRRASPTRRSTSDVRERVVTFPAVDAGSVLELVYTRTSKAIAGCADGRRADARPVESDPRARRHDQLVERHAEVRRRRHEARRRRPATTRGRSASRTNPIASPRWARCPTRRCCRASSTASNRAGRRSSSPSRRASSTRRFRIRCRLRSRKKPIASSPARRTTPRRRRSCSRSSRMTFARSTCRSAGRATSRTRPTSCCTIATPTIATRWACCSRSRRRKASRVARCSCAPARCRSSRACRRSRSSIA